MSNELTHNPGQFDEVIHIIDNARSRAMKAVNAELISLQTHRSKKWPLMQQWMLYIPEVQYLSPQKQARLLGDASVDQLARLWVFLLVI